MKTARAAAFAVAVAGIVLFLQGCYEERAVLIRGEVIPMTQQDVVNMVRDGMPSTVVIREIRESGTIFRLTANDVENLSREGVPLEVIDCMLSTREAPPVVVERPAVVVYDPWWAWDYPFVHGYYYYPVRIGLGFHYSHFGGRGHYRGYGVHVGHWR